MTFNKWDPGRPASSPVRTPRERRAVATRLAWWASTLMLAVGYGLIALRWNG